MGVTPLTIFNDRFETLQVFLSWSDNVHVLFFFGHPSVISFHLLSSDVRQRAHLKWVRPPRIHPSIDTLLLLQFYTDLFKNLAGVFIMVWKCACGFGVIIPLFLYQLFPLFQLILFSGPIIVRIDTLWVHVLLEFSTDDLQLWILLLHTLKLCV